MSPAGLTGMTGGPRILVYRLLGCSLRHRNNRYDFAAFGFGSERNLSIDEREQGVVFAGADIIAGVPFGAALTRKDVAGENALTAKHLQAKATARAVASVT
jgi:hypothetical protein